MNLSEGAGGATPGDGTWPRRRGITSPMTCSPSLYEKINERYFKGGVNALITWGKGPTSKSKERKTIKLGSYAAFDRLIRVHPALDKKWVPRYFVAYIVYHEMLHHVIPGSRGLGRVNLHPPEFKAREKEFRQFERSLDWEKKHVGRLLRT